MNKLFNKINDINHLWEIPFDDEELEYYYNNQDEVECFFEKKIKVLSVEGEYIVTNYGTFVSQDILYMNKFKKYEGKELDILDFYNLLFGDEIYNYFSDIRYTHYYYKNLDDKEKFIYRLCISISLNAIIQNLEDKNYYRINKLSGSDLSSKNTNLLLPIETFNNDEIIIKNEWDIAYFFRLVKDGFYFENNKKFLFTLIIYEYKLCQLCNEYYNFFNNGKESFIECIKNNYRFPCFMSKSEYDFWIKNNQILWILFDENGDNIFKNIRLEGNNSVKEYVNNHLDDFIKYINRHKIRGIYADRKHLALQYLFENFEVSKEIKLDIYKNDPYLLFGEENFEKELKEEFKKIKNESPIESLDLSGKKVHVKYHKYDEYEGIPVINYIDFNREKKEKDFEIRFLMHNKEFIKLYNKYYKKYSMNNENPNLKDFVYEMLFNETNLTKLFLDNNFTSDDLVAIFSFSYSYGEEKKKDFDAIYKRVVIRLNKYYLDIFNEMVKNKSDKDKLDIILKKYGFNELNMYDKILNCKFLEKRMKSGLVEIIKVHYGNCLKVIDIINILDEMLDKEVSLSDILAEKGIEKKAFMKLYNESAEENPILYEYIKESLSKNKRRGYKKLIRLGYAVLNSDIKTKEEFNEKFKEYDLNELIESLKYTELYNKLLVKFGYEIEEDIKEYKNKNDDDKN